MEQLSVWVGAGLVTAGVSAALLAGAGLASADTGAGTGASASSDSASSDSSSSEAPKPDATPKPKITPKTHPATETADDDAQPDSSGPTSGDSGGRPSKHPTSTTDAPSKKPTVANEPAATEALDTTPAVETATSSATKHVGAQAVSAKSVVPTSLAQASAASAAPSLLGVAQGVVAAVVVNVGSVALSALQAVEALVTGPPVLPPGSTVTERDSWITLDTGQRVAANWYYPKVVDDTPPTQMVLLNHGLLALGPMYSYTAANLAEETYSIVVTPTLPSNLFLGDSYWLGGTGMAKAVADLFVGDRTSLTRSALDAGYATQYGLDPADAKLPAKFALAGHSLGGNLVAAMAGFLADDPTGAADDLVGVIMLDGVPVNSTMTDALTKLDAYQTRTGRYIPIREIGAPFNLFNSLSNVNEALTAFRSNHYNGVVLTGGVHMDSMRGGNPLIQFAAYLVAGFPQPQNPPAVDALSVQWLKEWFGGNPYVGDGTPPGSTIAIGAARGVVIGNPPVAPLTISGTFEATSPTAIPALTPALAGLVAGGKNLITALA